ncbi:hypothetical protein [Bifidobacterium parmae]|uniref:30S ribosomal protein S3 n=1 Tax=Bifidobacterium parmae TaxID=361854 RepID=A0A2N5IVL2_9BIFI|nr:hypothetical protein [Bifidobacterium parmae]PLS26004.1 30S ribosomal protein S3 [Bifidobacterium parmae]
MSVEYWTAAQVSEYLGGRPSPAALAVMRTRGKGPRFVKLGAKIPGCRNDTRPVRYPVKEVVRWAMENGLQSQTIAA